LSLSHSLAPRSSPPHTQLAASPLLPPLSLSQPPLPLPPVPSTPPRSLPTPHGILGSLPAHPPSPKTPDSRPLPTAQRLPSGTSASPLIHTGPPQTSPPSTPHASDTLAPVPLPLCTALLLPPLAPVPASR